VLQVLDVIEKVLAEVETIVVLVSSRSSSGHEFDTDLMHVRLEGIAGALKNVEPACAR